MRIHSYEHGQFVPTRLRDGKGEVQVLDALVREDFETPFEFFKSVRMPLRISKVSA